MHRGKGKGKREGRWSIKRQSRYLDRLNVLWGKIPLTSPTDKTISLAPANCQEKLIHQNGLKTQLATFSFDPFFLSLSLTLSLFLSFSLLPFLSFSLYIVSLSPSIKLFSPILSFSVFPFIFSLSMVFSIRRFLTLCLSNSFFKFACKPAFLYLRSRPFYGFILQVRYT